MLELQVDEWYKIKGKKIALKIVPDNYPYEELVDQEIILDGHKYLIKLVELASYCDCNKCKDDADYKDPATHIRIGMLVEDKE